MPRKKSNTSPPPTRKRATRQRHLENREESPDEQGAILESTANSQAEAGAITQEKDNTTAKEKDQVFAEIGITINTLSGLMNLIEIFINV